MPYYRQLGAVPRQRHTQLRIDGDLAYEELVGEEGFSSDSALLYHRGVPSAITDSTAWNLGDQSLAANHPLKARHLRLHDLFKEDEAAADAVTGRRLVLGNGDVRICYAASGRESPLYRNAIGDECVYVESGSGTVETVFGPLAAAQGDYVVIPRGTVHRWVRRRRAPLRTYIIEAGSHIRPPRRYRSDSGQLLEHAPYSERDLHGPAALMPPEPGATDVPVLVKHREAPGATPIGHRLVYARHPFDVVGWDGCLYPYRFNVADFMPITGKVHQPPPVHQVFEGGNFVICNFVPRKVDYHPQSIPVPYYHSNVDSDEVMFYCGGDYEARKGSGIGPGSVSLHPGGVPTDRSPPPTSGRSAPSSSTSWPSWSTPSRRCGWARRPGPSTTAATPGAGRLRRRERRGMSDAAVSGAGTARAPAGALFAAPQLDARQEAGGTWRLRSAVPLGGYPPTVLASLRRWAEADPGYPLIAERDAGGGWRSRSYGEVWAAARAVGQGLLGLGLGPAAPLLILSGNSVDHLVVSLAAMTAGIPVAPVSTAYRLLSADHARVRQIAALIAPGGVFAEDTGPFGAALDTLDALEQGRPPSSSPAAAGGPATAGWLTWKPPSPARRSPPPTPRSRRARWPRSCSPPARPARPRAC